MDDFHKLFKIEEERGNMATSSSDQLWIQVKDFIEEKFGNKTTGDWRIAPTNTANCEICSESGGGVLIKCYNERKKEEKHQQ